MFNVLLGRKKCDICFQTKQCLQRCRNCMTNNICTTCYTTCMERNQQCPFCRQHYCVDDAELASLQHYDAVPVQSNILSQETLTRALNELLPETHTPGTVLTFQNDKRRTIKIIMSHYVESTPIGINIISNHHGQIYEYLNFRNMWSVPQLASIDVDEWHRAKSFDRYCI